MPGVRCQHSPAPCRFKVEDLARNFGDSAVACAIIMLGLQGLTLEAQSHNPSGPRQGQHLSRSIPAKAELWESQTTGKEYSVRVEGDTFQAEWVNIPQDSDHKGSYIRTTCHRQGSKWVGQSQIFLPCAIGHGPVVNRCHLVMGFEINQMSPDRVSGRIEDPDRNQFDCKSCKVQKTVWKDFVWVPKT